MRTRVVSQLFSNKVYWRYSWWSVVKKCSCTGVFPRWAPPTKFALSCDWFIRLCICCDWPERNPAISFGCHKWSSFHLMENPCCSCSCIQFRPDNFRSIRLNSNYRVNGLLFGNSIISGFYWNFSGKFPYHLSPFRNFPEFLFKWKESIVSSAGAFQVDPFQFWLETMWRTRLWLKIKMIRAPFTIVAPFVLLWITR